ncbi:hypothetical protein DFS34DRAFT_650360 [Phlyctochytrium arcticum]|nr:hypothetical protein DFS34DRAFT_650360 [Phlyctochytrium arcticum]
MGAGASSPSRRSYFSSHRGQGKRRSFKQQTLRAIKYARGWNKAWIDIVRSCETVGAEVVRWSEFECPARISNGQTPYTVYTTTHQHLSTLPTHTHSLFSALKHYIDTLADHRHQPLSQRPQHISSSLFTALESLIAELASAWARINSVVTECVSAFQKSDGDTAAAAEAEEVGDDAWVKKKIGALKRVRKAVGGLDRAWKTMVATEIKCVAHLQDWLLGDFMASHDPTTCISDPPPRPPHLPLLSKWHAYLTSSAYRSAATMVQDSTQSWRRVLKQMIEREEVVRLYIRQVMDAEQGAKKVGCGGWRSRKVVPEVVLTETSGRDTTLMHLATTSEQSSATYKAMTLRRKQSITSHGVSLAFHRLCVQQSDTAQFAKTVVCDSQCGVWKAWHSWAVLACQSYSQIRTGDGGTGRGKSVLAPTPPVLPVPNGKVGSIGKGRASRWKVRAAAEGVETRSAKMMGTGGEDRVGQAMAKLAASPLAQSQPTPPRRIPRPQGPRALPGLYPSPNPSQEYKPTTAQSQMQPHPPLPPPLSPFPRPAHHHAHSTSTLPGQFLMPSRPSAPPLAPAAIGPTPLQRAQSAGGGLRNRRTALDVLGCVPAQSELFPELSGKKKSPPPTPYAPGYVKSVQPSPMELTMGSKSLSMDQTGQFPLQQMIPHPPSAKPQHRRSSSNTARHARLIRLAQSAAPTPILVAPPADPPRPQPGPPVPRRKSRGRLGGGGLKPDRPGPGTKEMDKAGEWESAHTASFVPLHVV